MIVSDREHKRIIDADTGEYMTWSLYDREPNEWYFNIQDKDDKPLFGAIVQQSGWGGTATQGATDVLYSVKKVWFPSGKPETPTYFLGDTLWIEKLKKFLKVHKHYYGVKDPDPNFHFEDARSVGGGSQ